MSYQAGDTYPAQVTVRNDAGALVDPPTLALKVRDPTTTVTTYVYGTDAIIVRDSIGLFHADVPLDAAGMWVIAWPTTDESQVEGVQVWASAAPTSTITLCTPADVGTLLARTFTDAEALSVAMLCELATAAITDAVDQTPEWVAALDPVPFGLRVMALELVRRAMPLTSGNPTGLTSKSETIGEYSYTDRYENGGASANGGGGGMSLTDAEERRVRRIVWGRNSATTMPRTTVDQVIELIEDGEIVSGVSE